MQLFKENTTCLDLMNKYFPTLQPHNFNKDIAVYNKVV